LPGTPAIPAGPSVFGVLERGSDESLPKRSVKVPGIDCAEFVMTRPGLRLCRRRAGGCHSESGRRPRGPFARQQSVYGQNDARDERDPAADTRKCTDRRPEQQMRWKYAFAMASRLFAFAWVKECPPTKAPPTAGQTGGGTADGGRLPERALTTLRCGTDPRSLPVHGRSAPRGSRPCLAPGIPLAAQERRSVSQDRRTRRNGLSRSVRRT
jgi:hypothetical protein